MVVSTAIPDRPSITVSTTGMLWFGQVAGQARPSGSVSEHAAATMYTAAATASEKSRCRYTGENLSGRAVQIHARGTQTESREHFIHGQSSGARRLGDVDRLVRAAAAHRAAITHSAARIRAEEGSDISDCAVDSSDIQHGHIHRDDAGHTRALAVDQDTSNVAERSAVTVSVPHSQR